MKTEKISVIVPVYNNDKYISQCLESIITQSYTNIEIIIIDDASEDDSLKIINSYIAKDIRITCIHLVENSGVSTSRNKGIELASGKYIIFIDADDYWHDINALQYLYNEMESSEVEFISFGFNRINKDNNYLSVKKAPSALLNIKDDNWVIEYNIWAKIIVKQHIDKHHIRFEETLVMGEDALFNVALYCNATKIKISEKVLYNYRINPQGANHNTWSVKKLFDTVRWFEFAINIIIKTGQRNIILQSIIIERLMMLFNVLAPKAITMLNQEEKLRFFKQWSVCFKSLDYNILNDYFKSTKLLSLYKEMLMLLTDVDKLESFFISDAYLERKR